MITGRDAARLLTALASAGERFVEIARSLRGLNGVADVEDNLSVRSYQSGPMIEGYVDAELQTGVALTWTLNVAWDERIWTMRSALKRVDDRGSHVVMDLGEAHTGKLDDLIGPYASSGRPVA